MSFMDGIFSNNVVKSSKMPTFAKISGPIV